MATSSLLRAALAALVTLPSMCNVYRSDVGKLCDAEQLSRSSLKTDKSTLFVWMERNVASGNGIVLVRGLEGKDTHGIAEQLHDEARKVGLSSCALADQAETQAKDEDFRGDLANLCAGSASRGDGTIARLEILGVDDAERLREILAWTSTNARSPDTKGVLARLAALAPRQRGGYLRGEAAKVGVTTCLMAATLDVAPRPPAPVTQINPNFTVVKIDGPAKNQMPIGAAVTLGETAGEINNCFGAALLPTPTLTGKVSYKFMIDPVGHFSRVTDDGSTLKGPVVACIAGVLEKTTLGSPPVDGGKKGAKAGLTLLLSPTTTGPGYGAVVDPGLLAKAPRHH